MKAKRLDVDRDVFKFTNRTTMKFQPTEDFNVPEPKSSNTFFGRIRQFFSPPPKQKIKSPLKRQNSIGQLVEQKASSKSNQIKPKAILKYVIKLSEEHVLIGNEDQLDGLNISNIIRDFVDTEFLWSINIRKAILHVCVDLKKNYLFVLPEREIIVFHYEGKKMKEQPRQLTTFKLKDDVKFIQVMKQSTIILCYATGVQIFTMVDQKLLRPILQKQYELPHQDLKLYQIPQPYETILNIFFEEDKIDQANFSIWCVEVEFLEKQIKIGKASKIYDIQKIFKKTTKLQNYSKDIFFINTDREIFAMKKGYVIDFVNVDRRNSENHLKYLHHQKILLHILEDKVEIYDFKIDLTLNPPKIILNSVDSLQQQNYDHHYDYVNAVEMLNKNFAVFYQIRPQFNNNINGELRYAFYVTQKIKIEEKIRNILPNQKKLQTMKIEVVEERADMINKMGLQRKQIYLMLWNNSKKQSVEDFKFLLDTLDYNIIKAEIEKKLKKSSMSFREVQLIETGCLSMLSQNVFSPKCLLPELKNYLISHLFLRKLNLYKEITLLQKQQGKLKAEDQTDKLMINIQNYNNYKTMDIKTMLLDLISSYVNDDRDEILKIRTVLKHFAFSVSMVYMDILKDIIVSTKKKFLKILEAIPELLPYIVEVEDQEAQQHQIYLGLWKNFSQEEWEKFLYHQTLITIDNKELVTQMCNTVWFQRHWLTQHDYIQQTKKQIIAIHQTNFSENTFYFVIQKVFQVIKDQYQLKKIVNFLQNTYQNLPQHLFSKIFLYRRLFQHFKENHTDIKIAEKIDTFGEFLKLKDAEIFKAMLNYEKIKKGFILNIMKPLFIKLASSRLFNEGLMNYLNSDKSEISDIKYLLNRINNEKKQFHKENEGIYEVLVRGMQLKLFLGSDHDIPIDSVLIYIQNIEIENELIMKDLETMNLINQQSQRFKKIKLNMSIYEMMTNVQSVVAAMVEYEIKQANLLKERSFEALKQHTYRIIAEIQTVKEKIFTKEEEADLTLYTYLTTLLEEEDLIPFVILLLEDQFINKYYAFNQVMVENVVLYMYKWKYSQNPTYRHSQSYIRALVTLLPKDNLLRQFIQAEMDLAMELSTPNEVIWYPISGESQFFTSNQMELLIHGISGQHLLEIDIEKVYQSALKVQEISSDGQASQITLHEIYEIIILRLIECQLLKEVIQKIRTLIEIQGDVAYNFIYPCLLIQKISTQFIDENRYLLLACMGYLFHNPLRLLDIVDKLLNLKGTSSQQKSLLTNQLENIKKQGNAMLFSLKNPILDRVYLESLSTAVERQSFNTIIEQTLSHLLHIKQEFLYNANCSIAFAMLCNDPYVLVKYIYCCRFVLNIKDFRCFLSYIIKEDIFDKLKTLEFGKRLFFMIFSSLNTNRSIEAVIEEFRGQPLENIKDIQKINSQNIKSDIEKQMIKSVERLKFKIKSVIAEIQKKIKKEETQNQEDKIKRIKLKLKNPLENIETIQPEYPFHDSDDNLEDKEQIKKVQKRKEKQPTQFDAKFQRIVLMARKKGAVGLYVSTEKDKKNKNLFYTQKMQNDGLLNSLRIQKDTEGSQEIFYTQNKIGGVVKRKRTIRINRAETQYINDIEFEALHNIVQNSIPSIHQAMEHKEEEEHQSKIQRRESLAIPTNQTQYEALIKSLIEKLFASQKQIDDNTVFNFEILKPYFHLENFKSFMKELIQRIYDHFLAKKFLQKLYLIRGLQQWQTSLGLNLDILEIYINAERLQNKFKLDLPTSQMFPLDGLYLQEKHLLTLFNLILPHVVRQMNDENAQKIMKFVSMSLKTNTFESQLTYQYLLKLLTEYHFDSYNPTIQASIVQMHLEKITIFMEKIAVNVIKKNDEEMLKIFVSDEAQNNVIHIIVSTLEKKKDKKGVDFITAKWIKHKNVKWEDYEGKSAT